MNSDRIKLLEKFIEEEPENTFNKYALAMEYFDYDQEKAIAILEKVIADHPDYLPSYFKAAQLLWELEEMKKAEKIFKEGISLAQRQEDQKALSELKSAYQNFLFELD